jgi:hypothetical protein
MACSPTGAGPSWKRRRQRVAVEAPYELRRHPDATRHASVAAYVHMRGRAVIDTLVGLLIETVHHIGARAEHRVVLWPARAKPGLNGFSIQVILELGTGARFHPSRIGRAVHTQGGTRNPDGDELPTSDDFWPKESSMATLTVGPSLQYKTIASRWLPQPTAIPWRRRPAPTPTTS